MNFDKILNWKLLKGSHKFPGPDGGTCINEAAIVAAGFQYKSVISAHDCPPCFSRPIAAYAIKLNDRMPNDLRQKLLMPFVTRLAGTADTLEVEVARVKFIAVETVRHILSIVCEERLKRPDLAEKCRAVKTVGEARAVAREVRNAAYAAFAAAFAADADAAAFAVACAAADADAAAADAADADAAFAVACAAADAGREKIFEIACEILDGAIKLGKHEEIDLSIAIPRLEKIRQERILINV